MSLLAQYQPDRIKIDHELIRISTGTGRASRLYRRLSNAVLSGIAVSAVGVERAEEWMW
ncbi:hypothetical protein JIK52_20025 [Klebsiella variicola]|nr:hypothetical protein JIK52_20025 [Klebsiella variicola]